MSALQFSASFFSSLLGGGVVDNTAKTTTSNTNVGGDPFASLLSVVGSNNDASPAPALPLKKNDKRDNNTDPLIVGADAPVAFRNSLPLQTKKEVARVDNNTQKPTEKQQSTSEKTDNSANNPVAKVADKKSVATNKTTSDELDSDELDELQAKITDKIDSLSGLLAIIAALLAKTNNNAAGDNLEVTPASTQAAQVVTGNQDPQAVLGAVFADLKNTLSQIQQFLQVANGQTTPETLVQTLVQNSSQNTTQTPQLSEAQIAQLAQLNTALQADISALKDVLPQASVDIKQAISVQVAEVTLLLNSDISAIKDMLQKFKTNGNADVLEATSNPKHDILATTFVAENKPAPTVANLADATLQPTVKPDVAVVATETSKQSEPQVVVPPVNNNVQNSPIITHNISAITPASETNNNNFGGQQNPQGGQQNSQSAFAIGGVSTANNQQVNNASATRFSSLLNPANQADVAEQVVFHVKTAVSTGDSKIHIQLHPEDLGKLDITLDVSANGKTGVTITADNKQTLDLLQKDSSGLAKALADAGLKTDAGSLSFNLRGGEQQGQGQSQFQAASTYRSSQPEEDILPTIAAVTRSYVVSVPDGLDISI